MSASFRPQAIRPQPARLQRVELGQRVRVPSGDDTGKVTHAYTDQLGVRMAWVRWDAGSKGLYAVSSLIAEPDPFADQPDADHPIRWLPANGEPAKYLPLTEAVRRLVGYGFTEDDATRGLLAGAPFRTPFAFYQLAEKAGAL